MTTVPIFHWAAAVRRPLVASILRVAVLVALAFLVILAGLPALVTAAGPRLPIPA
ncbi:MAG: hypothetical protein HYX57_04780 [Chloroflexi bacterium]|nr:hypothetical protein [Chloroflexota bacterium]